MYLANGRLAFTKIAFLVSHTFSHSHILTGSISQEWILEGLLGRLRDAQLAFDHSKTPSASTGKSTVGQRHPRTASACPPTIGNQRDVTRYARWTKGVRHEKGTMATGSLHQRTYSDTWLCHQAAVLLNITTSGFEPWIYKNS